LLLAVRWLVDPRLTRRRQERICPTSLKQLTVSAVWLPFEQSLVRSRETLIGNLIVFAEFEFLASRQTPTALV
jgi:hypothetical protein